MDIKLSFEINERLFDRTLKARNIVNNEWLRRTGLVATIIFGLIASLYYLSEFGFNRTFVLMFVAVGAMLFMSYALSNADKVGREIAKKGGQQHWIINKEGIQIKVDGNTVKFTWSATKKFVKIDDGYVLRVPNLTYFLPIEAVKDSAAVEAFTGV